VVAIVWLTLFIGAFDRTNVSLLLVDPGFLRDMGLEGSPERQGLLMTVLSLAYAFSNILLSPAVDRLGPRRVLSAMVGVWCAASLLMGSAGSYGVLLIGRAVRGTAEGPLFPLSNRYVRNWFPPSERGGANAIWNVGQRSGLAVSIPILAAVIATFGWHFSFFLQAVLALGIVLPLVWFFAGDSPHNVKRVGKEELALVIAGERTAVKPVSWHGSLSELLSNWHYWLAVIFHFATLAVNMGLVTWLPQYLKNGRGFDVSTMVMFAALPHISSTVTGLAFGFFSDRFTRKAGFCLASLAGASVCICLAAMAPDPMVSAILMVVGFGSWGIGPPTYYSIMQRIVPGQLMATGIGIDNGLANFGAAAAPVVVGLIIGATGSYLWGLLFLAGVGAIGSMAAVVLVARRY
jgi:sugar phosphate permease